MTDLSNSQVEILRSLRNGPRRLVRDEPSADIKYLIDANYIVAIDKRVPAEQFILSKKGLDAADGTEQENRPLMQQQQPLE